MILIASSGTSAASNEDFGVAWVGDTSFTDFVLDPNDALAFFSMVPDGSVSGSDGQSADWRLPNESSIGDDYEVRFTLTAGTSPSSGGPLNTWLSLSSLRTIQNTQNSVGSKTSTILVEVRNALSGVVRISQSVSVTAIVDV